MTRSMAGMEVLATTLRPSWRVRLARSAVISRLARIRSGSLRLSEGGERRQFGDPRSDLRATVFVDDPTFWPRLALRGAVGAAEGYIDGRWHADDLSTVIRILARNREAFRQLDSGFARWARPSLALYHALRPNTREGSRRNIAAHYDLGNEFFELFLDPTLTYSCGLFEHPEASMEEASRAKYDRVCRKLRLGPDDHVLEIGTGWGGFALHAASRYGCRVTTTTISRRQHELARQRIAEAGLTPRVRVLFEDYRALRGRFDKLVSIEMIEAVGHEHLETFFRVCSERLASNGAMMLQAITVRDRDFEASKRNVDFVKRYIFPGGQLVSVAALCEAAAGASDLQLTHLEGITPHYAETLRRWRTKMFRNLDRIRALGLGEKFLRMWEYYLCYCEGGFEERQIGVVQALFEKSDSRRAPLLGAVH